MGYRHTREEILEGALGVALADGLSQLTYGRVAKALGISDRIVVYYFPSKDDLVGEVLVAIGEQLKQMLEPVFAAPAKDYLELLRVAWPIVAHPKADRILALFFEANGLAAAGREPYHTLVPSLVEAWVGWAAVYFEGNATQRRTEAETAITVLDGLLLFRQLAGPAAANRVARRIGVMDAR